MKKRNLRRILATLLAAFTIFAFTGCKKNHDKEHVADAKDALMFIDTNLNEVTTSFELYTEGLEGVSITWESSKPTIGIIRVLENKTVFVPDRPLFADGDVTLELTATLTKGKVTDTKTFDVKIIKLKEDIVEIESIAEARERVSTEKNADLVLKGKEILLKDVVVVAVDGDGYYIHDGEDTAFIYSKSAPEGVLVGDKGNLIANPYLYYEAPGFENPSFVGKETVALPETTEIELSDFWVNPKATANEIYALKNDTTKLGWFEFEALVVKREDFTAGANYQLSLVGKDEDGKYDVDKNFILSYYKTDLDNSGAGQLHTLHGKVVKVTATVRELRDSRPTTFGVSQPVWSFSITQVLETNNPDTQAKAAIDTAFAITNDFPIAGTLTLPIKGKTFDSTITWAHEDATKASLINLTSGAVTPVAGERIEVTLVATVTNGDQVVEKEYKVLVGDYIITNVVDFLALEVNDVATIKVVVTSLGPYNSYSAEDATGAVALRISGKNSTNVDFKVGDELRATVKKGVFNGLIQAELVTADAYEILASSKPLPAKVDLTGKDLTSANLLQYQSRLIKLNNVEITVIVVDSYGNYTFTVKQGEQTIKIKWDSRIAFEGSDYFGDFEVGDIVNLDGATMSWNNGPSFSFDGAGQIVAANPPA